MSKIQNLRSSVKGKMPEADKLEWGQLAVNINSDSPMIAFKTNDDSVVSIKPLNEWVGTQVEYDALTSIDSDTTYYIVEA